MVGGFFSEEKVSEVRERASILEVVSDYVTLKKTGRNYKGLCPFHSEKTPSFMVNEEKQIFHCFGCGEGGDVFTFLMKLGHFSFPQAVEELAKRYGIKLPAKELNAAQKQELAKRDLLFQINQAASEYYHDLLIKGKEGEEARSYLSRRGIRGDILTEHRLGYAPDRWDGLLRHLQERRFSLQMAGELRLLLPKKREGWYDAFRGRLIFPIFDLYQRIVGFGGRVIRTGEPKYLNSSESSLYHKGEVLYGLSVAKHHLASADHVLIVEGYLDLLMLHQQGFRQSVATLGTALTPGHIRILKRYTSNITTVFDGDSAGYQATLRCLPLFLEEGIWGETIILPTGEDPDSFLRKGNQEAFQKMIEKRIPLFDYFLEQKMKRGNMRSVEERVRLATEGIELIRKIQEGIRRDLYVKALAEKLNLREGSLYDLFGSTTQERGQKKEVPDTEAGGISLISEELLLSLILHVPGLIPAVLEAGVLGSFESPGLKTLAMDLERFFRTKGNLPPLEAFNFLDEDLRKRLSELVLRRPRPEGDPERMLRDCLQKIKAQRLKQDKKELLRKIREAEREKKGEELETLLLERQRLAERERTLQTDRFREG